MFSVSLLFIDVIICLHILFLFTDWNSCWYIASIRSFALQHGAMMVPMELIHVLLAVCISCVIADPQNVALYKNITALFSCGVFGDEVSVPSNGSNKCKIVGFYLYWFSINYKGAFFRYQVIIIIMWQSTQTHSQTQTEHVQYRILMKFQSTLNSPYFLLLLFLSRYITTIQNQFGPQLIENQRSAHQGCFLLNTWLTVWVIHSGRAHLETGYMLQNNWEMTTVILSYNSTYCRWDTMSSEINVIYTGTVLNRNSPLAPFYILF